MSRASLLPWMIVLLVSSQAYYAYGKQDQLNKPTWQKGDSWKIKCPVMSYHPNTGSFKTGEYTVNVKVLGTEKTVSGVESYVLEIRPGDDLPDNMKKNSDMIIERIYYATDTLELAQIERWQLDKDGNESKLGREVSTEKNPLSLVYYGKNGSWIPLLLPQFPLVRGRADGHCRNEYKVSKQEMESGENVALSFSGDTVVEAAEGKDALTTGSTKVTFNATTTYSKSEDVSKKKSEQIWVPGKRWWSIARIYDGQQVTEFTLVE